MHIVCGGECNICVSGEPLVLDDILTVKNVFFKRNWRPIVFRKEEVKINVDLCMERGKYSEGGFHWRNELQGMQVLLKRDMRVS